MDPSFWNNLPAMLTAINIILVTLVGFLVTVVGWFTKRGVQAVGDKVEANIQKTDENTAVTIRGHAKVSEKIESATKEVNQNANAVATIARSAVVKSAEATTQLAAATTAIAQTTNKIEKQLNGGPGGLGEIAARVASLEEKYDTLVQGQVGMIQSIDHLVEIIERKQY